MKILFIISMFCFYVTMSCVSTRNVKTKNCSTIIDSAKVFIQTEEFAINTKPKGKDKERNLRLDTWLQSLSFKNFTCLIDNEDVALKFVGFQYAAFAYNDSLHKNYPGLLKDTNIVQFFYADGRTSSKMKFGELLSMVLQKGNEAQNQPKKTPPLENVVSKFIRQYSNYPKTYKPISFSYFADSDYDSTSNFSVSHKYEIKNNNGVTSGFTNTFIIDNKLEINAISKDNYSYPLNINYWVKEFGRKLNKDDSLLLKLR
jgi:hypothetical protein